MAVETQLNFQVRTSGSDLFCVLILARADPPIRRGPAQIAEAVAKMAKHLERASP